MAAYPQSMSTENQNPVRIEDIPASGHVLAKDDPDNPQNLPVLTKIYVSVAATALAFVVFVTLFFQSIHVLIPVRAFGATSYTAGLHSVISHFHVSMQVSILGMSLYFWVRQIPSLSHVVQNYLLSRISSESNSHLTLCCRVSSSHLSIHLISLSGSAVGLSTCAVSLFLHYSF